MHYDEKDKQIIDLQITLTEERIRLLDTQKALLINELSVLNNQKNELIMRNKNMDS